LLNVSSADTADHIAEREMRQNYWWQRLCLKPRVGFLGTVKWVLAFGLSNKMAVLGVDNSSIRCTGWTHNDCHDGSGI